LDNSSPDYAFGHNEQLCIPIKRGLPSLWEIPSPTFIRGWEKTRLEIFVSLCADQQVIGNESIVWGTKQLTTLDALGYKMKTHFRIIVMYSERYFILLLHAKHFLW